MNQNELMHYGVLGMKWGVRRARKKGTTYKYKSMSTRRYEKKVDKAKQKGDTEKAKTMSKRLERSRQYDKNAQKISDNYSTSEAIGKAVITNMAMEGGGPVLFSAYTRMKASGVSKGKSMVATALTGPIASYVVKSRYIRKG